MIMRDRVPCCVPRAGLAAIGLLALLALPGWSQVDVQLEKKKDVAGTKRLETINKDLLATVQELKGLQVELLDDVTLSNRELALQALVDVDESSGPDARLAKEAEREKRLQALEQQIEALLKEVRALRAGNGAAVRKPDVTTRLALQKDLAVRLHTADRVRALNVLVDVSRTDANAVNLVRTSYNLPHAKAAPLAAFLREHVKAKVIETKVDGDSLTVTTTPQTQKAVGGLIALIQGKPVARSDEQQKDLTLLRAKRYIEHLNKVEGKPEQLKKP